MNDKPNSSTFIQRKEMKLYAIIPLIVSITVLQTMKLSTATASSSERWTLYEPDGYGIQFLLL